MGNVGHLNCVKKELTLKFEGKEFVFNLDSSKEMNLNAFIVSDKMYDSEFHWGEMSTVPLLTIYPLIRKEDRFDEGLSPDFDNPITIKMYITDGDKGDYFGLKFPNGFVSWYQTYAEILVELNTAVGKGHKALNKKMDLEGRFVIHDTARTLTDTFESIFEGETWEDFDWTDKVYEFVNIVLSNDNFGS